MSLGLQVILVLSSLHGIRCIITDCTNAPCFENPPFCSKDGASDEFCKVLIETTGNEPLDTLMNFIYANSDGLLTTLQVPFVKDYFFWMFQPNPLDTTDIMTFAKSFRLIVIDANSVRNISMVDVLNDPSILNLSGKFLFFGVSGYGSNCWGRNPSQAYMGWKLSDWKIYANKYNGKVIWLDYGNNGVSCYGYPQLLCLLTKIVKFLVEFLVQCIPIEYLTNLIFIGYSLGAQIVGYTAQLLRKDHGISVREIHALDPAGPGFGMGPFTLCQGVYKAADYSVSMRLNPCAMGTSDMCISDATILCNPRSIPPFIGPECVGNPNVACEHFYAPARYYDLTLGGVPVKTTYTPQYPPGMGTTANILITPGERLMNGYYDWTRKTDLPILG